MGDAGITTTTKQRIERQAEGGFQRRTEQDVLAQEEPLEIQVEGQSVAVVMRTPGHDAELVAGFLVTEGIIERRDQLFEWAACPSADVAGEGNIYEVLLRNPDPALLKRLTRLVISTSSCGICGKATIESVFQSFPSLESAKLQISAETLLGLPRKLREAQANFAQTGGLHASALFSRDGELVCLREDVGRHNALDKVLGHALLEDQLPLSDRILLVSGRISFELMQKALAGQIALIAGISAPSSLAIELGQESGQTVVGFLRNDGFNVYTHSERIVPK